MGGLAFLFAVIGLTSAIRSKTKRSQIMMFCSLSMGAFTVLEEINVIWTWYSSGEFGPFKSAAHIITTLTAAIMILVAMNLVGLLIAVKRKQL
jgi:hypothetical protein